MRKIFQSQAGVTLLETLLTLGIISLSLFGIIHSFYLIDRSNLLTRLNVQGLFLAEQKASEINLSKEKLRKFGDQYTDPFDEFRWDIKQKTSAKKFQIRELTVSWKAFDENKNENFVYYQPTHKYKNAQ